MNLTIDIGNTSSKIMVFDDTIPVYRKITRELNMKQVEFIVKRYPINSCMLSSVIVLKKTILNRLKMLPDFAILTPSIRLPIKNRYLTPATLGKDRLANAVAASFLFPKKNVLVIDAGTCIKYDFVNRKSEYLGGSITPGLNMRFLAMHQFTGKLPMVKDEKLKILIGRTTSQAMQTGVHIGILEEMKGFIRLYQKEHKGLHIILTGGDAKRFEEELNLSIFAASDLVNIGLNEIIRHNRPVRRK